MSGNRLRKGNSSSKIERTDRHWTYIKKEKSMCPCVRRVYIGCVLKHTPIYTTPA